MGLFYKKERSTEHHEIVTRLHEISHSTDELANSVLAIMVISVNLSLIMANTFDLLLGTDLDASLKDLAKSSDSSTFNGYVLEGLREYLSTLIWYLSDDFKGLDAPFQGFYRVSTKDQKIGSHTLKKGDRIFVDMGTANQTEKVFAKAATFDHTRSFSSAIDGDGAIKYLGQPLTVRIVSEVLRAVYAYNNIRRAPGKSGKLKRFTEGTNAQYRHAYLDSNDLISPWPNSLTVQFDA